MGDLPRCLGAHQWPDYAPLKRSLRLVELLAWCHRNGVIDSATRLSLHPGQSDLGDAELDNLLGSLRQFLPVPLATVDDADLLQPRRLKSVLLLVNVGVDPLRHHSQMNLHMATGRTDVLGYAGVRDNLVLTLDQLSLNSWNELTVRHYAGPQALPECLAEFLDAVREKPGSPPQPPELMVRCFCRNRAAAIAVRVEELFRETYGQLLGGQPSRYLLQIRQQYHLLEMSPEAVSHESLPDLPSLLQHLGRERDGYSALKLDRHALEGEDLGLILSMGRPDCIQVFYRRDFDSARSACSTNATRSGASARRCVTNAACSHRCSASCNRCCTGATPCRWRNRCRPRWISATTSCSPTTADCTSSLAKRRRPWPDPRCTSYRRYSNAANASACRSPCTATTRSFPNWSTAPACSRRSPGISWRIARKANPTPAT